MNEEELLGLIEKGESEKLEFKPSLSDLNRVVEVVCSFANKKGGIILIGVSDKKNLKPTERILGVQIGKDTIEKIGNKITDNTDHHTYPDIDVIDINGKKIIAIKVNESKDKPILAFGRAFIRVGENTKRMSKNEYDNTLRKQHEQKFDSEICEGANYEDIDWNFVNWFKEKYEFVIKKKIYTSEKDLLKALGCIKNDKPTNAGILLFGKITQELFTNSRVTVVVYPSTEVGTKHIDIKDFHGNLIKIIDKVDEYIRGNTTTFSYLKEGQLAREEIPQYPYFVIRELLVNAVAHRDYTIGGSRVIIKIFKDRIEYQSPGPLPGKITPENIVREIYHRNPILMKVFSKIKYVEEIGEGWDRIIEEINKHPLKPKLPKIKDTGASVIVSVYSPEGFEFLGLNINERQKKAIEYIKKYGKIKRKEYVDICKCSERTALNDLTDLVKKNIVLREGSAKNTFYVYAQNTRKIRAKGEENE